MTTFKKLFGAQIDLRSQHINEGDSSDTVRPKGTLWSGIVVPHSQENNRQSKTEPEIIVITSVLTEQQEREKKKRNVIIFGLRETRQGANSTTLNKDKTLSDQVKELFDKISGGGDKVESAR